MKSKSDKLFGDFKDSVIRTEGKSKGKTAMTSVTARPLAKEAVGVAGLRTLRRGCAPASSGRRSSTAAGCARGFAADDRGSGATRSSGANTRSGRSLATANTADRR